MAAGVPNEAGAKPLSVEDALMLKPPRRPQQPWMPELEEFKAEQPKYASECLNYENLWKEVSETFTNEEDEEVMTISKLEAEPATKRGYHSRLSSMRSGQKCWWDLRSIWWRRWFNGAREYDVQ